MSKNLVIVESPAKAKTIEKFLGKDFVVKSSFGHIRDLPKKGLNIDIEHNFAPNYEISADKKKVVSDLKKAAKDHEVWLASDEDREGEAIAWHLAYALKLNPEKTKRIVFHEITKSAIDNAIKNPRTVDTKLVHAQQARRILDRLVGYELSPVLWRKVRSGLSAGRVQSVAVRLIVEREREIRTFETTSTFKVVAEFLGKKTTFPAELTSRFTSTDEARKWLESVIPSTYTVKDITRKPGSRSPSAPFTTSTLQQEASRRLGFSVRQTMNVAQRLYESGHITYMRTDSTLLSGLALNTIESYIKKTYGDQYYKTRQFRTKDASAQEAHEAIRPTVISTLEAGADDVQKKLYRLIWQRAVASQMSEAALERTDLTIDISGHKEQFLAKGEIMKFDGFMKVYGGTKDDVQLPDVSKGETLDMQSMKATQTFDRAPARYSEAALVRKLEELGIGRPSTYAPTISIIQTRGYVEKVDLEGTPKEINELRLVKGTVSESTSTIMYGADRSKLVPTPIAEVTNDFLVKNFPRIVDYDFTARAELDFDEIADGNLEWPKMIKEFYQSFHTNIEEAADVSRQEVSQARELGIDPVSKEPIFARYGRYGPMLQKGDTTDEATKPIFAPLPADTTIDSVTIDQALEMFKLPRLVGATEDGEDIWANIGRFGPYIKIGSLFVSIKPFDPHSITEAEARKLHEDKLAKEAAKHIAEFPGGIKVLNGPYGAYVTDGKKNARISKTQDPAKLTEAEAKAILEAAPAKKRGFRRKSSAKSRK